MTYKKTIYVDGVTVLEANNFNNNENAVEQLGEDVSTLSEYLLTVDEKIDNKSNIEHSHLEYVEKIEGKGLSSNDFTDLEKDKLKNLQNADVDKSYVDTELGKKSDVTHNHTEYLTELPKHTHDEYLTELPIHNHDTLYATKGSEHSHNNKSVIDGITASKIIEWNSKSEFDGNYNNLTNKPNIPTKVSELVNDNRYLTEHQDISGKADKNEIPTKTSQLTNDSKFTAEGHKHTASDISNLNTAINEAIAGAGGTAHTHGNLTILEKITDSKITKWDSALQQGDIDLSPYQLKTDSTLTTADKTIVGAIKEINAKKIPTKTSELTNDTGYLTQHQDISNLVEKEEGKGLSTKDFTEAFETKLKGIENNANNYIHPSSHNATMIIQDATHRFVSDQEKTSWNSKSEFSGDYNDLINKPTIPSISGLVTEGYVDEKIADLVGSSPETLDTLQELADALGNDPNFATTVANQIGGKAEKTHVHEQYIERVEGKGLSSNDFTTPLKSKLEGLSNYTHPSKHEATIIAEDATHRFVTDVEKAHWNSKSDTNHNHNTQYATKLSEHTHTNKNILDTITSDKITQWDNKSNFSGNYSDLNEKPNIPAKTSDLENDSGFITIDDIPENGNVDLSEYAKKTELHSHRNIYELNTITSLMIDSWSNKPEINDNYVLKNSTYSSEKIESLIENVSTGGGADLSNYQTKTDNTLSTSDKTVTGAINELDSEIGAKGVARCTKEFFTDITPSYTLWETETGSEQNVVISENGFKVTTNGANQGLQTQTLTDIINKVKGKKIVMIADSKCETSSNYTIYVKMFNGSWSFLRLTGGNSIGQITVPNNITNLVLAIESDVADTMTIEVSDLKLYLANDYTIESNADIPDRDYSIWAWNVDELLNPNATLQFCKDYKINKIYQDMSDVQATDAVIRTYTKTLQSNGIEVEWLAGQSTWATTEKQGCYDEIQKLINYNNSTTDNLEKIKVIQLDVEPHTLPDFEANRDNIFTSYMEMVENAYDLCKQNNIKLNLCIGSWYETVQYNNTFGSGNVYDFVSAHSDITTLMAYTRMGYAQAIDYELKHGKKVNKPVVVGFETQYMDTDTDVTYWGQPIEDLYFSFEVAELLHNFVGTTQRREYAIHYLAEFKNYLAKFPNIKVTHTNDIKELLGTSNKTVVGAINELNNKISSKTNESFSVNGYTIWTGTQSEYDVIGTKSNTTIYFVKEG